MLTDAALARLRESAELLARNERRPDVWHEHAAALRELQAARVVFSLLLPSCNVTDEALRALAAYQATRE